MKCNQAVLTASVTHARFVWTFPLGTPRDRKTERPPTFSHSGGFSVYSAYKPWGLKRGKRQVVILALLVICYMDLA